MNQTKRGKATAFHRRRGQKAERGGTHARKAAEDLGSAAGAMAIE